jgi:hypothetical protein
MGMTVNVRKCCITGALRSQGNPLSLPNRTLLASRLQKHIVTINTYNSPIPSIDHLSNYGLGVSRTLQRCRWKGRRSSSGRRLRMSPAMVLNTLALMPKIPLGGVHALVIDVKCACDGVALVTRTLH